MPTTTNYGWTTPADTDLVKDGASAIRTLGNGVDTSLKTVSDGRGLVHINTTSFSAVSSQSINDVFSSTYNHYKIVVSGSGSTTATLDLRLRVSGSDNSTSNYYYAGVLLESSTAAFIKAQGDPTTYFRLGTIGTNTGIIETTISNPQQAEYTGYVTTNGYLYGTNEGGWYNIGGAFSGTTSFTGFTLIPASGTITGRVSIYGYK
jgi:hypothetical protein